MKNTEFQLSSEMQLLRELLEKKVPDAFKLFAVEIIGVCFRYFVKYGTIVAIIYKLGFEALTLIRTFQLI